ncbi:MAG: N-acetyltransferase [Rubrivivax sp.]|nr:N-acetyltransferase [Rubrivivax sp.]
MRVEHHRDASRFEAWVDGECCVCQYRLVADQGLVLFTHTEVPPRLGGRGIAAALVGAAFDWVRSEGLKLRPLCSYVAVYLRRHPQQQDLLG